MSSATLTLTGFAFKELFTPSGLTKLDAKFLQFLQSVDPKRHRDVLAYRHAERSFTPPQVSALVLDCAPILETFVGELFNIQPALTQLAQATRQQDPIFRFKQTFVQRRAKRSVQKGEVVGNFAELGEWLEQQIAPLPEPADKELAVARFGVQLLEDESAHQADIERLTAWCVAVMTDPRGQAQVQDWVSFRLPQRLDYQHLVPREPVEKNHDGVDRYQAADDTLHQRDGFSLTDLRMSARQVLNQANYCIYCHHNEGDFCSKGFPLKKSQPQLGLKTNPLGDILTGCPLEEKISEMHLLYKNGYPLAALAVIMIDNPLCAVTGHRICNDCMKACIYQKQEPVDIPQIETRVLTDVLDLPWGVEIYDLFIRWHPLRTPQWLPEPYNGRKVLVMGMGPAGFTLAHHLLMAGCAVVGADGLKIEPLPIDLIEKPVHRFETLTESLDQRRMLGFGGVAEYGITVRWDKNFLKLIYLSLLRRPHFQVFGGIRFGGTLLVEDAWQLGFDHMALAVGAGLPKELPIPGSLAPGMRQANDVLMALQLTGAAKADSLANLQIRLPALVIGGGLTGIDTATEIQAYYIKQVDKVLLRYEQLTAVLGEERLRQQFSGIDREILQEFVSHGRVVREERQRAKQQGRAADFISLLRAWGGVTIVYRRHMHESPAYKRNHLEVIKALEEGVLYVEGLNPTAVRLDQHGHVAALLCESGVCDEAGAWTYTDVSKALSARTLLVATGAKPNIAYEFEHRGTFHREGSEYQAYDVEEGQLLPVHFGDETERHSKVAQFGPFTSYVKDNHRVTFLGDTHPVFHGNVVKAIASAKRTYPHILKVLADCPSAAPSEAEYQRFASRMDDLLRAKVTAIQRHAPGVVELTLRAPQAVKHFQPGQFYRLQNFESEALQVGETRLQTESMAMLGAEVDQQAGTVKMMVYEQGASSRLVATFQVGQPMALMGPTGVRTKIPRDAETIMIIGGQLGIAYLRAVGPALRAAGNRVLYVACLQSADELHCRDAIEQACDAILWVTQTGPDIQPRRPQDDSASGEFMSALLQYAQGDLSAAPAIRLQDVDRILLTGRLPLVKAAQQALSHQLAPLLVKQPKRFASVYGPMQCMLKGVCAQCLQWQIDPATGQRTKAVYTCSWQDQPLDLIDLTNLDERLQQNRVQEILTNLWLDQVFTQYNVQRV